MSHVKFLSHIVKTPMRPDITLVSESTNPLIIVELTVPWKDCLQEGYERKRAKYEGLVNDCQNQGCKARSMPIEVGSKGFARQSLYRSCSALGINGVKRRAISSTMSLDQERRSIGSSVMLPGDKSGSDQPWLGCLREGV